LMRGVIYGLDGGVDVHVRGVLSNPPRARG
jgi:hypothetical protein